MLVDASWMENHHRTLGLGSWKTTRFQAWRRSRPAFDESSAPSTAKGRQVLLSNIAPGYAESQVASNLQERGRFYNFHVFSWGGRAWILQLHLVERIFIIFIHSYHCQSVPNVEEHTLATKEPDRWKSLETSGSQ